MKVGPKETGGHEVQPVIRASRSLDGKRGRWWRWESRELERGGGVGRRAGTALRGGVWAAGSLVEVGVKVGGLGRKDEASYLFPPKSLSPSYYHHTSLPSPHTSSTPADSDSQVESLPWIPDFTSDPLNPDFKSDFSWTFSAMAVDLLRNCRMDIPLSPFDSPVAATVRIDGETYFITTNMDYVPDVPSIQVPHALFLRSDMRYGTYDYTLWPQQWTAQYCHLPIIAKKGARPEIDIMWWDPTPADFEVGKAITRGLGRLRYSAMNKFLPHINEIVGRGKKIKDTSHFTPLFGELMQGIMLLAEQLQTLPTKYNKMVGSVLWVARVPFWFLRPTHVFDAENIFHIVSLLEPRDMAPDLPGEGSPAIIYSGNSTSEKIAAIHCAAVLNPWYRDPFETANKSPAPAIEAPPIASSSRSAVEPAPAASSFGAAARANKQQPSQSPKQQRARPYPSQAPPKQKGPAKVQRDKFTILVIEQMPLSIAAWADALAGVDRSVAPFTSDPADKRYVLPEPALLVNSSPERHRKFLHHWTLLSDGFLYMLSQPEHTQLLSAQEWRDLLEVHLTERGHPGSRTQRRSAGLVDRLRPALEASNISSLDGFPASPDSVPDFTLAETQEIVWQVAETSFHFEFASLDRRASKKARLDKVKACFASGMLLGAPLEMSKCGWAAPTIEKRFPYAARAAELMLDWMTKCARPDIMRRVAIRLTWSEADMQLLKTAVCRYYTQAFWEHFGRAAVVPLRLDHDVEREDGQL
ncbi:hypothetical protein B0H17DRAFT_1135914 [Mycena rosella]|uniref:Uncharacterized protein n=1 Tax=Mycena rosella TaxID=1033263 RepID=A0AAD7GCL0_MYCRO|nr:hypothetical protein B0H17DRAFT_1135914 [Mycena rosella]